MLFPHEGWSGGKTTVHNGAGVAMTKMERVVATLRHEETDRVPFSVYVHSTVQSRGVEPFVKFTLDFHRRYDPDYVKVMYDENYDTPVNYQFMQEAADWRRLELLDAHLGAYGRQIEALKRIKDAVGPDVPVIQTIYSTFHTSTRLAWTRLVDDIRRDPETVQTGFEVITTNTANFARACVQEAGIDGFFLGALGCENRWLPRAKYARHALPHDRRLLAALRTANIVIVHIHGEKDSHFDLFTDCDCDALSWEDRLAGPSIAEARARTDRCLVGGIDHAAARSARPEEIIRQGREAIAACGARGLILAPGCTLADDTPPENVEAIRAAAGA